MTKGPTSLRGRARAAWLRSAARRAAKHPRADAAQVAAFGRLLLQIKAVLGHGRFRAWVKTWMQDHVSYALCAEAMRFAQAYAQTESAALRNFGPSAVRVLARKRTTKAQKKRLLEAPKGRQPIGKDSAELLTLACDDDDPADCLQPWTAAALERSSDERQAWDRLQALLASADMIHISIDRDPESAIDRKPPLTTVTLLAYLADGTRQRWCRQTLAGVLLAAAGEEAMRICPKCNDPKPPEAYAKSTKYCRLCERVRVKAWTQKTTAARRAADDPA